MVGVLVSFHLEPQWELMALFQFLSHCRGILPEKVDLINVSVIYLPPLKLLSCCRSSSYTVTLLWATPASKLPSTVIRSCGT